MLEPETELPWKLEESIPRPGTAYVFQENELDDLSLTDWIPLQDAKYIVQACNNFPKAVELLYQSLDYIRDFGSDTSHMYKKIRQYLEQLEDEK